MYDVKKIRNDFPMIQNNPDIIYFDSAATSFKPNSVIEKVKEYYEKYNTNIHRGDYDLSFKVSNEYENTRETVKEFINANDSKEIVFTSGDTTSINTLAFGFVSKLVEKDEYILTSEVEHASDILPLFKVSEKTGCRIAYIPMNNDGTFNIDEYKKCFDGKNIKFVSLTYVSNVLGYIYPIKEICKIAHDHGAIVHVDGAQAVPHIKVDVKDLDVDFLSFSSHKMLGPDGVGVLYGKFDLLQQCDPLAYGGGSNARFDNLGNIILKNAPYKFESGTPNVEGVLGFNEAMKYLMNIGMNEIQKYDEELVKYLLDKLTKLDNVVVYNSKSDTGIVSFNVKGVFAQDAATYLNKNGICVRAGNHCAKILNNIIGTNESIRASLYLYNTKEEVDKFIEVVKETTLEKCIGAVI